MRTAARLLSPGAPTKGEQPDPSFFTRVEERVFLDLYEACGVLGSVITGRIAYTPGAVLG
jgi:hypothetical protein